MMRFFLYAIGIIVLLTVIRLVAGLLGRVFTKVATGPRPAGTRQTASNPIGGALKKDPVCGTYVAPAAAIRSITDGREYFFCSDDCRKAFDRSREKQAV